jgi:hypothetical protein
MTEREEFSAWCGKRRPLSELLPLVSNHEETRQWHCEHVFLWPRPPDVEDEEDLPDGG